MKTKFKRKKNKKRRTLKKDVGRGLIDANLVKDLLIENGIQQFISEIYSIINLY